MPHWCSRRATLDHHNRPFPHRRAHLWTANELAMASAAVHTILRHPSAAFRSFRETPVNQALTGAFGGAFVRGPDGRGDCLAKVILRRRSNMVSQQLTCPGCFCAELFRGQPQLLSQITRIAGKLSCIVEDLDGARKPCLAARVVAPRSPCWHNASCFSFIRARSRRLNGFLSEILARSAISEGNAARTRSHSDCLHGHCACCRIK